jgi:hypothetical protein
MSKRCASFLDMKREPTMRRQTVRFARLVRCGIADCTTDDQKALEIS